MADLPYVVWMACATNFVNGVQARTLPQAFLRLFAKFHTGNRQNQPLHGQISDNGLQRNAQI
jgi:hypothetical protein